MTIPSHEQAPTDLQIAIERLSKFSRGSMGTQQIPPLRILPDHVAIVLNALHTVEEKYQWLCKHAHRITCSTGGTFKFLHSDYAKWNVYHDFDALVTAELSRTKETAS